MKPSHAFATLLLTVILTISCGCSSSNKGGPKELLDKYFTSAIKQDYAATYNCYYAPYKEKITKEDFIKHRKEASVLLSYKIVSLTSAGNTAQAEVVLTFAPSEKLKRTEPATVTVKEELIKENEAWKIKVW